MTLGQELYPRFHANTTTMHDRHYQQCYMILDPRPHVALDAMNVSLFSSVMTCKEEKNKNEKEFGWHARIGKKSHLTYFFFV